MLAVLRNRFPSRAETFEVFAACAVPVFIWAIIAYLDAVPGFILRLSIWDVIGTASYVLAFALVESIVFLVPFVVLAFILPGRLLRDHFGALGSVLALITAAWAMHLNYDRLYFNTLTDEQVRTGIVLYLLSILAAALLIVRFKPLERLVRSIMDRVTILAYVYVAFALVSILIILIRNI